MKYFFCVCAAAFGTVLMLGSALPGHAAGPLVPPQHLAYQPGSLVWNAVPGAEYYLVAQANTHTGPYRTFSAKHLSANAALPGLAFNTHYYFVVYAAAKEGLSPASDPVDVFLKPYQQPKRRSPHLFPSSSFRAQELLRHSKKH